MAIRTKIYLTLVAWLVVCVAMFLYGFKILDGSNRAALAQISKQKNQMLSLRGEAESYLLAQQDLRDVRKEKYQPDDFFSQDVTLVKEIQTLEGLGQDRGINLSLGGINGTINNLPKAQTKGQLFVVPFSISVNGQLNDVVDFIERLENLNFIATLHSLNMSTAGGGRVNAAMSANFYIRKGQ